MLRSISAILCNNFMMKRIIPIPPATANVSTSKRKMSGGRQETENVIMHGRHQESSENPPPDLVSTITTPPVTVPTDANAVPESPFVPDFDADPPIRPGDNDDPNESLEASTSSSAGLLEASDEKPPPF
ncbi:hypothetical protein HAX54_048627 [Datura stramonium]|uniref:Uncharacterized protein n=1 Tax=Datura stramonium TaxID=4076 RepID=A0ABS8Y8X3_DATST|nr:hypothetical protein [Datura stramonium]